MEHPSTSLPHKWLVKHGSHRRWTLNEPIYALGFGCTTSRAINTDERHFLHHTTHIHNSRMFAFPRSASIIALNTASENVHHSKLGVSNKCATPTQPEHPRRLNVHPHATNLKLIPSIMAHTSILEDGCCGACPQQTPLHPQCRLEEVLQ